MDSRYLNPLKGLSAGLLIFYVSVIISGVVNISYAEPFVEFADNRLTIEAKNDPLVELLEKIAKKTNVVIFVSKNFDPGLITIHLQKVQLAKAFKTLLKQHNIATIYNKQKDKFVISALKVYPKGKNAGKMDVLITKSSAVKQNEMDEDEDENLNIAKIPGSTIPGEYVKYAAAKDKALIHAAHGFKKAEEKASRKINELKKELTQIQTDNDEQHDMLTLELMDRLVKFENMQRDHINALESLYRAALFKKNSRSETE